MPDLSEDPIMNSVHEGIKRGIGVALESGCYESVIILALRGIDTMAYLSMPANQEDVKTSRA